MIFCKKKELLYDTLKKLLKESLVIPECLFDRFPQNLLEKSPIEILVESEEKPQRICRRNRRRISRRNPLRNFGRKLRRIFRRNLRMKEFLEGFQNKILEDSLQKTSWRSCMRDSSSKSWRCEENYGRNT